MAVDYRGAIDEGVEAGKLVYVALQRFFIDRGLPRAVADIIAGIGATPIVLGRVLYVGLLLMFVTVGSTVAIAILQTITQIRKDGANDFAQVTAEAVGEFMAIDIEGGDFAAGKGKDAARTRAQKLGKAIHEMLIGQFAPDGHVTPQTGENAARTFTGYVTNFATGNAFMSIMSEILTLDHLEQFKELGVEIAENLGLGRLHRRAMQPLVQNTISKPYDRLLRARYRQDFLSQAELLHAFYRGAISEGQVRTYLAEKGIPDDQIGMLLVQARPRLTASELVAAEAYGLIDSGRSMQTLRDEGIPDDVASARLNLLRRERTTALRRKVVNEALKLAQEREMDPAEFSVILDKAQLPGDEAQAYRDTLGLWLDVQHTRLSKLDITFLYEHGQLTLDEVREWAREEGYNPHDELALELEILQKTQDFQTRKDAAAGKTAGAAHARNVAFVTDQFLKIAVRTPNAAELKQWVDLLDSRQRTRADVTAELKLEFEK